MQYQRFLTLLLSLLGALAGVLVASVRLLPIVLDRSATLIGVILMGYAVVLFLISPVAVFFIGYWNGKTVDVASEYRNIALRYGLVGAVASIAGFLAVFTVNRRMYPIETVLGVSGFLLNMTSHVVGLGTEFAIVGLAGAAVAHFRSSSPT